MPHNFDRKSVALIALAACLNGALACSLLAPGPAKSAEEIEAEIAAARAAVCGIASMLPEEVPEVAAVHAACAMQAPPKECSRLFIEALLRLREMSDRDG